ncbi:hypothetical protein ACIA8O_01120 [Kitasatospora sp. NPDC051853]|uniref:hypothetical protein n=1 Tax=Kitasatospora sp. NPDC051853 TaxID=3364058 RepID=UPI0037A00923
MLGLSGESVRLTDAEAALVANYPRLVGIARLVLPDGRTRHRRVLAAHAAVQRALPLRGPETEGPAETYAVLRSRLLRGVLRPRRRDRLRPGPVVLGLRLFSLGGDPDELMLDRELGALERPARAAFALAWVDGLTPDQVVGLLVGAGVAEGEAARAVRAAGPSLAAARARGDGPEHWPGFDACRVRVQPSDLLRRRRVAGGAAGALVLAAAGFGVVAPSSTTAVRAPSGPPPAAAARAEVTRVADDLWRRTARVDFTAWPGRGGRRDDGALVERAVAAWRAVGPGTPVEAGTVARPPVEVPHLMYAGTVDGVTVVVLYDGVRLARYTEGPGGGLLLGRAEDSDVTSAAAVVLTRTAAGVRYLLAPWIDTSETRRIDQPAVAARPLAAVDGVTGPVPVAAVATGCPAPVLLQLRSTPVVAEQHAFLLADVGGLRPARLSYTPPPEQGPARSPREAVSAEALRLWASAGCVAPDVTAGVRQLNLWAFAGQQLPENAGRAEWLCLRADRWGGDGSATTAVLLPGAGAARRTGRAEGRACSRYEQDTLGWAWWRSPQGVEYVLAAASRRVERIRLRGPGWVLDQTPADRTSAMPRPRREQVEVEAVQRNGTRLVPLP